MKNSYYLLLKLFALLSLMSVSVYSFAQAEVSKSAKTDQRVSKPVHTPETLLRPYYDELEKKISLPMANIGPELNVSKPLHRIAFGSCNHQGRSQHMWSKIGDRNPDIFLAIGDNVYGDFGYSGGPDLDSFINAYRQQANHQEFRALRSKVPMLASWDDHDFGPNDSGGNFAFKEWSEKIFETFWNTSAATRSRPGVYDAFISGPVGQRTQIIMLDTRFFRSPLKALPYQDPRPPLGRYIADNNKTSTILGDQQWKWLKEQLDKPAELRIIVSSIQILTDAHGFEKWGNFPVERQRLFSALKDRSDSAVIMLSGDRHSGAIYSDSPTGLGEEVWEITSSSLNLAFSRNDSDDREPDPRRKSKLFSQENFGLVDIDWNKKTVRLSLIDNQGESFLTQVSKLQD